MKKIVVGIIVVAQMCVLADAQAQAYVPMPQAPEAMDTTQPYCREYQQKVTIEGKTQSGYGTACLQPDGSWQLIPQGEQNAQVAPQEQPNMAYVVRENQVYLMPPEPFVYFQYDGGRHYYPRYYPYYYRGYHGWGGGYRWHH